MGQTKHSHHSSIEGTSQAFGVLVKKTRQKEQRVKEMTAARGKRKKKKDEYLKFSAQNLEACLVNGA